jgi:hypothetical protein
MKRTILKKMVMLAGLVLLSVVSRAQQGECGTVISQSEFNAAKNITISSVPKNKASSIVKVKVFIVCSGATSSTAATTLADIDNRISDINAVYSSANIEFERCSEPRYLLNSPDFNFPYDQYNQASTNDKRLCERNDMANVINLYVVNKIGPGNIGGYAQFLGGSGTNRVIVGVKRPDGNNNDLSYILIHELGHIFGLLHPCGFRNGSTDELVDGSNSATTGDLVEDTPADPFVTTYLANTSTVCAYPDNPPTACSQDPSWCDANNELYQPLSDNHMFNLACPSMINFTQGQFDRISSTYNDIFQGKVSGTPKLAITSNSPYNLLLGCFGLSFSTRGYCDYENPIIEMTVREVTYNPMDFSYPYVSGTDVKRVLTTSEYADLVLGSLDFTSFSNGSNSITLQPNKYYLVNIVNKGLGNIWEPNYFYFHAKPGKHDYSMRDFAADIGEEPSDKWEDGIFKSPDLWNNVPASLGFDPNEHDEPDFVTAPASQGNMMRFNLRNIGCNSAPPATPHELRLFWTRARTTELWDKHWIYSKAKVKDPLGVLVVGGSEITIDPATGPYSDVSDPIDLQDISPNTDYLSIVGQSLTEREWFPPNPSLYDVTNGQMSNAGNRPVICFLAVINDKNNADDPLIWEPTTGVSALPEVPVYQFTKNNNNVVTRNSILMDEPQYLVDNGGGSWDHGFGTVLVNNDQPTARPITLCVDLDDIGLPTDFRAYGRIEVGVTNGLWNNWVSSGMNEENMTVITPTLFELTDVHGCIEDILVLPGSNEQIGLRFVYDGNATLPSIEENYEYVLSATYGESTRGTNSVFQARVPIQSPLNLQNKRSTFAEKMEQEDLELIVYPNPAKEEFLMSASLPEQSHYTITLTDAFGRLLEEINTVNTTKYFSHKFDMTAKRDGIYYITLKSGELTQQKRVILVD